MDIKGIVNEHIRYAVDGGRYSTEEIAHYINLIDQENPIADQRLLRLEIMKWCRSNGVYALARKKRIESRARLNVIDNANNPFRR